MADLWLNCYRKGWNGNLVPEAFSHPAKVAFGLAERIYQHIQDEGWVAEGDCIIDPFGGIGGFAFHAMRHGLNFIGVELEQKFVDLGSQNIDLWNSRYSRLPHWGTARIVQGDSRELAKIVGEAGACVSSPPYAATGLQYDKNGLLEDGEKSYKRPYMEGGNDYGQTPGQLGAMPAKGFEAAVSSPPYENHNQFEADCTKPLSSYKKTGGPWKQYEVARSDGQLGNSNGDDFWSSARLIVEQTYQVLAPSAHAVWVVKGYVKNKQFVDFPGQWRQLCEAVGFVALHEHHAMLVEERGTQHTLEGEAVTKRTERKSFFRRLAEKNGSPRIDYETVLCMVKP